MDKSQIDIHRNKASKMFGVKPEDITLEQRRLAKAHNFWLYLRYY